MSPGRQVPARRTVEVRFADAPPGHSFLPAWDAFARAAGHEDFATLVDAQIRRSAAGRAS